MSKKIAWTCTVFYYVCSTAVEDVRWLRTREDEVQQDSASPVLDAADGGKVNVHDEENNAAKEADHAHGDAVVAGVCVLVKDAEQSLAANVDVALVDDAAEHHHGENLQGRTRGPVYYLTGRREWTHTGVRMPFIPHTCHTKTRQHCSKIRTYFSSVGKK